MNHVGGILFKMQIPIPKGMYLCLLQPLKIIIQRYTVKNPIDKLKCM